MIKMHGVFLKIPKYLYNTTIQEDKFLFLLYNVKEIVRATTCDQSYSTQFVDDFTLVLNYSCTALLGITFSSIIFPTISSRIL